VRPSVAARASPTRGTSSRGKVAWLAAITTPTQAKDAPTSASLQPKRSIV
jgi:hypothetical protein